MRRALIIAGAAAALGLTVPTATGFAGQPIPTTTTTEPPGTTTTPAPPTTTGPTSNPALVVDIGPAALDGAGGCTIASAERVEGYLDVCVTVTNTGDVPLVFVESELTTTVNGEPVGLFGPEFSSLIEGVTVGAFAGMAGPIPLCPFDTEGVDVMNENAVEASVTVTFEAEPDGTNEGEVLTEQASDTWTALSQGVNCVPTVDDPPTFTG
jgi:hypothetical protein